MRRLLRRPGPGRIYAGLAAILALATLVGLAALWPGDVDFNLGPALAADSERAEVERITERRCSGRTDRCRSVTVELQTGPDQGSTTNLELGVGGIDPELSVGDKLRVIKSVTPGAAAEGIPEDQRVPGDEQVEPSPAGPEYTLSDFERRSPMLVLVLVFALLVVAFGRLRGALSLTGLAVSLALVLAFIVPAILDGSPPLLVALVGASAVMLVTIALAHGLGAKSLSAMLGTGASLLLTAGLAVLFTDLTQLTGLSSEEATLLQVNEAGVSLEGLLLAGIVIGALGVLDDVTISQASTVMALRAANPGLGFRELYSRALRVGRDHVSATVNTLVLAYVGASLPVLLIFSSSEIGFFDAVNVELVAKEVVATMVGSIGLIAAVPITTALAALLATRTPADELPAGEGAHAH